MVDRVVGLAQEGLIILIFLLRDGSSRVGSGGFLIWRVGTGNLADRVGLGQGVFKISRVGSGRVGSGRVGSGRFGSGGLLISRVETGWAVFYLTRENRWIISYFFHDLLTVDISDSKTELR